MTKTTKEMMVINSRIKKHEEAKKATHKDIKLAIKHGKTGDADYHKSRFTSLCCLISELNQLKNEIISG